MREIHKNRKNSILYNFTEHLIRSLLSAFHKNIKIKKEKTDNTLAVNI